MESNMKALQNVKLELLYDLSIPLPRRIGIKFHYQVELRSNLSADKK
jgi:hypothetical protein